MKDIPSIADESFVPRMRKKMGNKAQGVAPHKRLDKKPGTMSGLTSMPKGMAE